METVGWRAEARIINEHTDGIEKFIFNHSTSKRLTKRASGIELGEPLPQEQEPLFIAFNEITSSKPPHDVSPETSLPDRSQP